MNDQHTDPDPVLEGVRDLAGRWGGPMFVLAAALEHLAETGGASWSTLSRDTRRRFIAHVADGYAADGATRREIVDAFEVARPAEALVALSSDELAALIPRVEVARENPFDDSDAAATDSGLQRLRDAVIRRATGARV